MGRILVPHPVQEAQSNHANRTAQESPLPSALDAPPIISPVIDFVSMTGIGGNAVFTLSDQDAAQMGDEERALASIKKYRRQERISSGVNIVDSQDPTTLFPATTDSQGKFNRTDFVFQSTHVSDPIDFNPYLSQLVQLLEAVDFSLIWSGQHTLMLAATGQHAAQYLTGYQFNIFPATFARTVDGRDEVGLGFTFSFGTTDVQVSTINPTIQSSGGIPYSGSIVPIIAQLSSANAALRGQAAFNAANYTMQAGGAERDRVSRVQIRPSFSMVGTVYERGAGRTPDGQLVSLFREVEVVEVSAGQIRELPLSAALQSEGGPGFPFLTSTVPILGKKVAIDRVLTFVAPELTIGQVLAKAGGNAGGNYMITSW